jgi:hypothetical protein
MAKLPVQFRLNGSDRAAFVDPADNLLTTLRRGLGDFAPKYGCGQGTCGVCTVLIDGEPHLSCLTLAVACEGKAVETASGMADGPDLHPLQAAFMENFAAPVRLLHARHADCRPRAAGQEPQSHPRGRHRRHRGQHLPLHGLRADHRGHPGGGGRPQRAARLRRPEVLEFRKDLFADERDDNLNVVGKGLQRQDMPGHVTGRTRFFDDHAFEGLLHLKVSAARTTTPATETSTSLRQGGPGSSGCCAARTCR